MNYFKKLSLCCFFLAISACGGSSSGDDEAQESSQAGTTNVALRTCGQQDGPLRIMPLGDSITHSERGQNSYRRPLWFNLRAANCVIDFVGSRQGVSSGSRNGPSVPARNPDFDQDHEGYWDFRADEVLAFIGQRIDRFLPDVVLIHLGTNDIFQGQSVESTIVDLGSIVSEIRRVRPDVAILLAKVIPSRRQTERLVQLNSRIDALAESLFDTDSTRLVVDKAAG